jgi:hypothetical protein
MVYFSNNKVTWNPENTLYEFLISAAYFQALFALPFNANAIGINNYTEKIIQRYWKQSNFRLKAWNTIFFQNTCYEI